VQPVKVWRLKAHAASGRSKINLQDQFKGLEPKVWNNGKAARKVAVARLLRSDVQSHCWSTCRDTQRSDDAAGPGAIRGESEMKETGRSGSLRTQLPGDRTFAAL
jgi:hypothetical protein